MPWMWNSGMMLRQRSCAVSASVAPLTTGLRVLVRIMYRRQASDTWGSMSSFVENAVARLKASAAAYDRALKEKGVGLPSAIQAQLVDPVPEDPRVLPCPEMRRVMQATREQVVVWLQRGLPDLGPQCRPGKGRGPGL